MTRSVLPVLLLVVLGACARGPETPQALLARMLDRYDATRGAVGGLVVTGGGAEATHGALPDSTAELAVPVIVPVAGESPAPETGALLAQHIPNVRLLARALARATMEGPRDLRGRSVYILTAEPDTAGAPTLFVVVDAETFDVREIEQSVRPDTLARPLVTRLVYDDFRPVDGVPFAFRVRQINEGVDQLIPIADRMFRGGQASVARGQVDLLPPGRAREERRAALDREVNLYTRGVQETEVRIDRIRVVPRAR